MRREATATSGLPELDGALGGLYWGDNVVWETEEGSSVEPFYAAIGACADRYREAFYVTLEEPPESLEQRFPALAVVDARPGGALANPGPLLAELRGLCRRFEQDLFLFGPIETMVEAWGAETARRFFARCCPMLLELGAVAYWSLERGGAPRKLIREVEEITQCVLAVGEGRVRITKAEGRPPRVQGSVFRYTLADGSPRLTPAPGVARLGAALKAVRGERGLSQSELARLAGVSASAISQAERGQRGLSLETLLDLTGQLGMSLDDFLRGETATGYRLARRGQPRSADGKPAALSDDPRVGLRAYVVRLPPGGSGSPPLHHKGVELVAVAEGLVQVVLTSGRPVLREGEALVAERAAVSEWRNLGDREAVLFWVLRDESASAAAAQEDDG